MVSSPMRLVAILSGAVGMERLPSTLVPQVLPTTPMPESVCGQIKFQTAKFPVSFYHFIIEYKYLVSHIF